jgi:hypothetical protein
MKRWLVIFFVLVVVVALAQVSSVSTFANLAAGQGGRILFTSDTFHLVRDTGTALDYHGPLLTLTPLPNSLTGWSWVNQSGATVDTAGGTFYVTATAVTGTHNAVALVKTAPATPWTVVAVIGALTPTQSGYDSIFGIEFRESSSGKLTTCQWESSASNLAWHSAAVYWTSPATPISNVQTDSYSQSSASDYVMLRARDDGTSRYCDISADNGAHWQNFYTQGRTVNMTADQVGFMGDSYQGTATPVFSFMLVSWSGA